MKTTTKLILGGLAVIGLISYFGYKKALKIQAILNQMVAEPAGVSNVKIWWKENKLTFNLDIKIVNPTKDDFFITSGGIAGVKKIIIFYKGNHLGDANVNITDIEIPAENELLLKNIEVEGTLVSAIEAASLYADFNINDLTVKAIVDIMGKQFEISQ